MENIKIEFCNGEYNIGNVVFGNVVFGKVPIGCDCIIKGWHFKNGKLFKEGTISFPRGKGKLHIIGNTFEN